MKNIVLRNIKRLFIALLPLWAAGCVQVELDEFTPGGEDYGDKVRIDLFTNADEYTQPTTDTRAGSAHENSVGTTPWVFVFKGTDENATFVQVEQAVCPAANTYVLLNKQTTDCRLLIIANAPANFSWGGTTYAFNKANLTARFTVGYTTLELVSQAMLTEALANPQTSVPYASTHPTNKPMLPMSGICQLTEIKKGVNIGTSGSPILLNRAVAKVAVVGDAAGFTFKAATVVNIPTQGYFHNVNGSLKNNGFPGCLTYYYGTTAGNQIEEIAQAETISGKLSTANNPMYVYECRKEEKPFIVVKGTYGNVDYYYRLKFQDASKNALDILRNKYYTFTITSVAGPGYTTFNDAKQAQWAYNDEITYSVDVIDLHSHDIVTNGEYYLGVSNSEYHIYAAGVVSNSLALMVTTDRVNALEGNSVTCEDLSAGAGGTSMFRIMYGVNSLTLAADASTPGLTYVHVYTNNDFTHGKIHIRLGDLTKTIEVKRYPIIEGIRPPMEFSNNYVSAESTGADWVKVSLDGIHANDKKVDSDNGTVYLMFDTCWSNRTGGEVFLTRKDNGGRLRIMMYQAGFKAKEDMIDNYPANFIPYVGTFHRANQTGERLISVTAVAGAEGDWTAEVISGREWIILDTNNSTDPNIYTNNAADMINRDAQYQVTGSARKVTGTVATGGKIAFRVGLTSKLSYKEEDFETPPRYGLIKLTYADNDLTHLIYVRQGEAPDYLMRPGDKSSTNTSWGNPARPMAKKWSVFSLTDPDKGTGGINVGNHTDLGARRAIFAEYPSQAGYFFRWNGKRAYHPTNPAFNDGVGGLGHIVNWPTTGLSTWVNTREVCPVGYRHPIDGPAGNNVGAVASSEVRLSLWQDPVVHEEVVIGSNQIYGLYADGFFDRKPLYNNNYSSSTGMTAGLGGEVAYVGALYFNPYNAASLFIPYAGFRNEGINYGNLEACGSEAHFWSSTSGNTVNNGWYYGSTIVGNSVASMMFRGATRVSQGVDNTTYAYPVRCVKD